MANPIAETWLTDGRTDERTKTLVARNNHVTALNAPRAYRRNLWTTNNTATPTRTISTGPGIQPTNDPGHRMPTTSALRPTGSTRAWRQLRQPFADHLAHVGPLNCRRCQQPIHHGDRWHLGHATDRALGGTDTDLWPEHEHCNTSAGARLGNQLRHQRHHAIATTTPSRDW